METTDTPIKAPSGYYDMDDLKKRFKCSDRSIYRYMKAEDKPFPQPKFNHRGSKNLWSIDEVHAWEISASSEAA